MGGGGSPRWTAAARRRRAGTACRIACAALLGAACGGSDGSSLGPADVLVVVNGDSPISQAIGRAYRALHRLPESQQVTLRVPLRDPALGDARDEEIDRAGFIAHVRDPLADELAARGDGVLVLVVAKGVPLRVRAEKPPVETWLRDYAGAAVDAELALLGSGRDGLAGVVGAENPYLDSPLDFREFRRRHPEAPLRYLVTRLTGFQTPLDPDSGAPADVQRCLEAAWAEPAGDASAPAGPPAPVWLVDESPSVAHERNAGNLLLLEPAAALISQLGWPLRHDRAARFLGDAGPLAGYLSWGSNDPAAPRPSTYGEHRGRVYPGRFAPRAVAFDLVSTSARTFTAPPRYGQSLIADLVRLGAAGAAGHVAEPTLSGVARPHVFVRHLAQGASAAEAFYRSLPYLGWQNVYVGDPLMRLSPAQRRGAPADRDGDGVPDVRDNCLDLPNADQRDSDGDGFGSLCDADVDGDGRVTTSWGISMPLSLRGDLEAIALAARSGEPSAIHDLDGNGQVDAGDLALASSFLFAAPGPSGLVAAPGASTR